MGAPICGGFVWNGRAARPNCEGGKRGEYPFRMEAAPPRPTVSAEVVSRMEKSVRLYDRGTLKEEEYQRVEAELIARRQRPSSNALSFPGDTTNRKTGDFLDPATFPARKA